MKRHVLCVLTAFVLFSLPQTSSAFSKDRETIDNCRCPEDESNVISLHRESYNIYEIQHLCGQPHDIVDYGTEKRYVEKRLYGTGGGISAGTIIEGAEYKEWVYDWDSRRYILFFLFKDTELIRIQRLDKEAF